MRRWLALVILTVATGCTTPAATDTPPDVTHDSPTPKFTEVLDLAIVETPPLLHVSDGEAHITWSVVNLGKSTVLADEIAELRIDNRSFHRVDVSLKPGEVTNLTWELPVARWKTHDMDTDIQRNLVPGPHLASLQLDPDREYRASNLSNTFAAFDVLVPSIAPSTPCSVSSPIPLEDEYLAGNIHAIARSPFPGPELKSEAGVRQWSFPSLPVRADLWDIGEIEERHFIICSNDEILDEFRATLSTPGRDFEVQFVPPAYGEYTFRLLADGRLVDQSETILVVPPASLRVERITDIDYLVVAPLAFVGLGSIATAIILLLDRGYRHQLTRALAGTLAAEGLLMGGFVTMLLADAAGLTRTAESATNLIHVPILLLGGTTIALLLAIGTGETVRRWRRRRAVEGALIVSGVLAGLYPVALYFPRLGMKPLNLQVLGVAAVAIALIVAPIHTVVTALRERRDQDNRAVSVSLAIRYGAIAVVALAGAVLLKRSAPMSEVMSVAGAAGVFFAWPASTLLFIWLLRRAMLRRELHHHRRLKWKRTRVFALAPAAIFLAWGVEQLIGNSLELRIGSNVLAGILIALFFAGNSALGKHIAWGLTRLRFRRSRAQNRRRREDLVKLELRRLYWEDRIEEVDQLAALAVSAGVERSAFNNIEAQVRRETP